MSPTRCAGSPSARRLLGQKLNRDPTIDEIALETASRRERVQELLELVQDHVSLDTPIGDGESVMRDLIEDLERRPARARDHGSRSFVGAR